MRILDEPRIDCHVHVFDPQRFAYREDTHYRPAGHEIATAAQLAQLQRNYGVAHALVVGPNSAYGEDNRCLVDAVSTSDGRLRGVAVVAPEMPLAELLALKAKGVCGVAVNLAFFGTAHAARLAVLLPRLEQAGLFLQLQVEGDQLVDVLPLLADCRVPLVFDHCGRPVVAAGLQQPGFQALLALGAAGRAVVKLSGYDKFSLQAYPYADTHAYVQALLDAFTPARCVWASDWPFLRAGTRQDYGSLLVLAQDLMPDKGVRHQVMWETPSRLFDFG